MLRAIIISFCLLFVSLGYSQSEMDAAIQTDTLKTKDVQLLAVPLVFYTPETNLAFGAAAQMFFKTKNSTAEKLNSNILGSFIYTLNQQIIIEATSQVYFSDTKYFLDGKFRYRVFPYQFWGLGPDTPDENEEDYEPIDLNFDLAFLRRLTNNVNFGLNLSFADYQVTNIAEGGILDTAGITGSSGATVLGLGLVLNIDERDNSESPLTGSFSQFKTNFASRAIGSSHSFNVFQLDFRNYYRVGEKQVLATQVYGRLTFGDAPFQSQSYYGGGDLARGFFKGRYIDQNLYVIQAEYRRPVGKRWEMAVFALTGNVSGPNTNDDLFSDFKTSAGLGPRYFIYKDRRTCLRLDIGFNDRGQGGFYFGVNEAF